MRRSNWKSKLVVMIAVVIGILCGLVAAFLVNQKFGTAYIGLAVFYYHAIGGRNLNVFDDPCISYWRVGSRRKKMMKQNKNAE